jgi:predicted RNase H-like HicB family nuclease
VAIAFPLRFERDEDGGYVVQGLPPLDNVMTEGATLEQARAMAREALSGILAFMLDDGQAIPRPAVAQGRDIELIAPEPAICKALEAHWKKGP